MTIELGDLGKVFSTTTLKFSVACSQPIHCPVWILLTPSGCALVVNRVMLLLLDSGSTHSFVSTAFVHSLQDAIEPMDAVQVLDWVHKTTAFDYHGQQVQ
jgi:Co/Zn/Cd efflux system component